MQVLGDLLDPLDQKESLAQWDLQDSPVDLDLKEKVDYQVSQDHLV